MDAHEKLFNEYKKEIIARVESATMTDSAITKEFSTVNWNGEDTGKRYLIHSIWIEEKQ